MLQNHVKCSIQASIICYACDAIFEECGDTEEEARRNLVTDAMQEGWRECNGKVLCPDCQGW